MPDEKKSKLGPKEAELRAMREARLIANKKIIDKNTKAMNKAFNVKDQPHQTKTRKNKAGKTVVVTFKQKRGRSRA